MSAAVRGVAKAQATRDDASTNSNSEGVAVRMQLEDRRTAQMTAPVVVTLGKQSRKRIRQLKRGKGKLINEVSAVVEQVRSTFGQQGDDKVFVPVVLVYRRKPRGGLGLLS
jgi:hypothetical protein